MKKNVNFANFITSGNPDNVTFIQKLFILFFLLIIYNFCPAQIVRNSNVFPSKSVYSSNFDKSVICFDQQKHLINLNFLKWLHDEYGMAPDIYMLDVGNIDYAWRGSQENSYGSIYSASFKLRFPDGLNLLAEKAESIGCQLGFWLGPDGFGLTPQEAEARTALLVKLCRDYHAALFVFDTVCSILRPDKEFYLVNAIKECKRFSHNLTIVCRGFEFSEKNQGFSSFVITEPKQIFIDFSKFKSSLMPFLPRANFENGTTHQIESGSWDDALIWQVFNDWSPLSPAIYGNAWLLSDNEYATLAYIYGLHKRFSGILLNSIELSENQYEIESKSIGNGNTRFITMRNDSWVPVHYAITVDSTVGLAESDNLTEVRIIHPFQRIVGRFRRGAQVDIEISPFRTFLIAISTVPLNEPGVIGCDFFVERYAPGMPVRIQLAGMPGKEYSVKISGNKKYSQVFLDGKHADKLHDGNVQRIKFNGQILKQSSHRKLADLTENAVPQNMSQLFETACFASNNNALAAQALTHSVPTKIKTVEQARLAYFNDTSFVNKGQWDKFALDNNQTTAFKIKSSNPNISNLRIDFGKPLIADKLIISHVEPGFKPFEIEVSNNLSNWTSLSFLGYDDMINIKWPSDTAFQYFRITNSPKIISEIKAYLNNNRIPTNDWHVSNSFVPGSSIQPVKSWQATLTIDEASPNSYLTLAVEEKPEDIELITVLSIEDQALIATGRKQTFTVIPYYKSSEQFANDFSFAYPITNNLIGKKITIFVLALTKAMYDGQINWNNFKISVWQTSYPNPYVQRSLVLYE